MGSRELAYKLALNKSLLLKKFSMEDMKTLKLYWREVAQNQFQ